MGHQTSLVVLLCVPDVSFAWHHMVFELAKKRSKFRNFAKRPYFNKGILGIELVSCMGSRLHRSLRSLLHRSIWVKFHGALRLTTPFQDLCGDGEPHGKNTKAGRLLVMCAFFSEDVPKREFSWICFNSLSQDRFLRVGMAQRNSSHSTHAYISMYIYIYTLRPSRYTNCT